MENSCHPLSPSPMKTSSPPLTVSSPLPPETEIYDFPGGPASQQQEGLLSMNRSNSSKQSSYGELEDGTLLYLKDNVTIHPAQYEMEQIRGRLKLLKRGSSLFMAWIPYKVQSSNTRLSETDRNLYTISPVPFEDIQSIRRQNPTIGWQYVIVVLSSGLAFPPLYFYDGGAHEFLDTIKRHVCIFRSSEDSNIMRVNGGALQDGGPSNIQWNSRQRENSQSPGQHISIQVMEKFSRVTRFARETTSQLLHAIKTCDEYMFGEKKSVTRKRKRAY